MSQVFFGEGASSGEKRFFFWGGRLSFWDRLLIRQLHFLSEANINYFLLKGTFPMVLKIMELRPTVQPSRKLSASQYIFSSSLETIGAERLFSISGKALKPARMRP